MDKVGKALVIAFPAIVASAILGFSGDYYLLASIVVLSALSVVLSLMGKLYAPIGSVLAYLASLFGSSLVSGNIYQGIMAPFVGLFLSPIGVFDGLMLYYGDKIPILDKLGKALLIIGTVLDVLNAYGAVTLGYAGFALGINAPFFLTSAIVSVGTKGVRRPAWRAGPVQVSINVSTQSSSQQAQSTLGNVTFVITGLPQGYNAVIEVIHNVHGRRFHRTCYGNGVVMCPYWGEWRAKVVQAGNITYIPKPNRGWAKPGDTIYITYVPLQRPAPQRPIRPTATGGRSGNSTSRQSQPNPNDPLGLIGKTLGAYEIVDYLGGGGMGYVYLARSNGVNYAVKVLKVSQGRAEDYFKDLMREAGNLTDLSGHGNIVKIYAVSVDMGAINDALKGDMTRFLVDPPRIVMEFMEGGSLEDYLANDTFFYSSSWERAVIKAIKQIAEALDYIHRKGYIHSDVKPQNVFLTKKPKDPSDLLSVDFKLGDLGSAVRVGKGVVQATPEYYPPEIFTDTAKPSMDVFALGITLYVLLTRKNDRPDLQAMNEAFDCYINNDMNCVKQKVEESKRLLASWDPQVQEPYKTLIKRMTDPDPMKRPVMFDIINKI